MVLHGGSTKKAHFLKFRTVLNKIGSKKFVNDSGYMNTNNPAPKNKHLTVKKNNGEKTFKIYEFRYKNKPNLQLNDFKKLKLLIWTIIEDGWFAKD